MATDEQPHGVNPEEEVEERDLLIAQLLKKTIASGVRTVLKSEETVRHLASEVLRNERVGAVGARISDLREDILRIIGREIKKYLDRLNLTDEIVKILTAISLEIKTELRFIPNDKRLISPNIKHSVNVKSARGRKAERDKDEEPESDPDPPDDDGPSEEDE